MLDLDFCYEFQNQIKNVADSNNQIFKCGGLNNISGRFISKARWFIQKSHHIANQMRLKIVRIAVFYGK